LTKFGCLQPCLQLNDDLIHIYQPFPYYLQSDNFSLGHLHTHLPLACIDQIIHEKSPQHPPLHKWLKNLPFNETLSNHFWNHPPISTMEITKLIHFQNAQICGQLLKTSLLAYSFPIFHVQTMSTRHTHADTWPHLLSSCSPLIFCNLYVNGYNKTLWPIQKLLLSHHSTKYRWCINVFDLGKFLVEPCLLISCLCSHLKCS
jgi:hypothetical protein